MPTRCLIVSPLRLLRRRRTSSLLFVINIYDERGRKVSSPDELLDVRGRVAVTVKRIAAAFVRSKISARYSIAVSVVGCRAYANRLNFPG